MENKINLLHTAKVMNHCPKCYSKEGLQFTFTQEEVETKLYRYGKKEVAELLQCQNCQQVIYPVDWTNDIERVYHYNKKLVQPLKTGFTLMPLGWLLVITDTLLLLALLYFFIL